MHRLLFAICLRFCYMSKIQYCDMNHIIESFNPRFNAISLSPVVSVYVCVCVCVCGSAFSAFSARYIEKHIFQSQQQQQQFYATKVCNNCKFQCRQTNKQTNNIQWNIHTQQRNVRNVFSCFEYAYDCSLFIVARCMCTIGNGAII